MNFILTKQTRTYVSDDAYVLEIHKNENGHAQWDTFILVNAIVNYSDFEDKPFNYNLVDSTASNKQVVKQLYRSSKGVFYNGAGGYWTVRKKGRTYLTNEELSDLEKYIKEYYAFLKMERGDK